MREELEGRPGYQDLAGEIRLGGGKASSALERGPVSLLWSVWEIPPLFNLLPD